jgi:2-octaprenyl-6-methoxyphenol hydroxylase
MADAQPAARFDILIAGANYTGLAAALCLTTTLGVAARIVVIDRAGPWQSSSDPRCFALSAAARNVLARLGVWAEAANAAQDVRAIALTDSPLEAAIRPILLRYDNRLDDGTAAASIVPGPVLLDALRAAVERSPAIAIEVGGSIERLDVGPGGISVATDQDRTYSGSLLVGADGRGSKVRALAGIKATTFAHQQVGIVATIKHSDPHEGCAIQHFLPAGPFAILPLVDNRSCITWSEDAANAKRIMTLDDAAFLDEIDRRVAGRLGHLELDGPRGQFPLTSQLARAYVGERLALVGDAAHAVHPIAGQGLNLALRDVAALAEKVADGVEVGLDFGDPTILEAYERWRRFDATLSAGVFGGLNKLFSSDFPLVRSVREAGLGMVDRLPGLKRRFVEEAAGLTGDVPKLMQPLDQGKAA